MKTLFDAIIDKAEILGHCGEIPTIKERVKYALQNGIELTQGDANRWPFCTSRLGAFIYMLRKEGCLIETVNVQVKCGDGHIAIVAKYIWKKELDNGT